MSLTQPESADQSAAAGAWTVLACAGAATLVSLFIDGFEFGVHNNVYHVPYVLGWDRLPAFADDAFVQSLRYFTSAVWLLLRALCTEDNVQAVFLAAHVATRLATFAALAALVRQAGITDRAGLALVLGTLAVTPWMHGASIVAGHGMLINYFTHSEVAGPFLLFGLHCALQARWRLCAVFAALAFLANAFVGLWLLAMLAAWVAWQRRSVRLSQFVVPALLFGLIAAPLLVWVSLAMGSRDAAVDFSFAEYLRLYYPRHFFLDSSSAGRLGLLVACLLAGWSSSHLVPNGRFWRTVLGASMLLFAVGAVTPYFIDARLLFNLHLMRVDGVVQAVSLLLVACAAARILADPASLAWQRGALLLAVLMLFIPWRFGMPAIAVLCLAVAWGRGVGARAQLRPWLWLLPLTTAMLALNWAMRPTPASSLAVLVVAAGLAALWLARRPLQSVPRLHLAAVLGVTAASLAGSQFEQRHATVLHAMQEQEDPKDEADWTALAAWLRGHPIAGEVLVPIEAPDRPRDVYLISHNFQLHARTPVWVDWKQGAAVMWSPQFFHRWAPRYRAARELRTPPQFLQFAREQGIPYFVPPPYDGPACPEGAATLHASGRFKLCATQPVMSPTRRP